MVIITLLTDFGIAGSFPAEVKGVILSLNPAVTIVDITHAIEQGNVDEAAWVLARAAPVFPKGTIHVAVVDPGVGGGRAVLAIRAGGQLYLVPDNGLLKYILDAHPDDEVFRVDEARIRRIGSGDTFHGRDIFAPAAARLSLGETMESLGVRTTTFERGRIARPVSDETGVRGEIVYLDPFGNAVSNIVSDSLNGDWSVVQLPNDQTARCVLVYADGRSGELIAYPGSAGMIEIAVVDGSAKAAGLSVGDPVEIRFDSAGGPR
jgi:S-adenosyl-L-methionine hydrolase (adenosine-forming)